MGEPQIYEGVGGQSVVPSKEFRALADAVRPHHEADRPLQFVVEDIIDALAERGYAVVFTGGSVN